VSLLFVVLIGCGSSGSSGSGNTTQPPVANAGGPYSGMPGVALNFTGSKSADPQGEALTYGWSFGDGTTGTGANPTHAYSTIGTYSVSLTVTDTSKLTSAAATTATIKAQPPVPNAGGPYAGFPGTAVDFDGGGSGDPQGETLTYSWTFGDGSKGTGENPAHVFAATGLYTVSLTVTDTSGLSSSVSTTATINTPTETTGSSFAGVVYSGNQTISGAHVYLFAANPSGYMQPSISLLSSSVTGFSDNIGAYVPTNSNGTFTLPAGYGCPVGSQLYIYAMGGTIGSVTNSAAGLLAALGTCGNGGSNAILINEVTTIATAYAIAGFAVDATHVSSSGTALAQVGVTNAFANFANLANGATGVALDATPSGNGAVPQGTINTLADILNACVSSSGPTSTQCSTLFTNAQSGGSTGALPTDTASAAINIAHNPGANVASLYGLQPTTPSFSPALSAQPSDFTLGIQFTGGGIYEPTGIAIDASGDAWISNQAGFNGVSDVFGSVTKLSSAGVFLSGAEGYTGNGIRSPEGIAIDLSGNAWVTTIGYVVELSNSGSPLSGTCAAGVLCGYTTPNITLCGMSQIAIDASGNAWFPTNEVSSAGICTPVIELSSSGAVLSGPDGYVSDNLFQPYQIAIDGSGNAWVTESDNTTFTEFSNSGAVLSGKTGYQSDLLYPGGIAIDSAGNAWSPGIPLTGSTGLEKLSNAGAILGYYTGGGLMTPIATAIDGAGNVWIADAGFNGSGSRVGEFSGTGAAITGPNGYTGGNVDEATAIAVDGSGNVWIADGSHLYDDRVNAVTELIGAATPVITPVVAGLPNPPSSNGSSRLGTRP
jgi:PKD repeat protein